MRSEPNAESLSSGLQALEAAFEAEQTASRRTGRLALYLVLVLLGLVLTFGVLNYAYLRSGWTEAKLTAGLERELERLSPRAMEELQALVQTLLPVYGEEIGEQFEAFRPEIERRISEQMTTFSDDLESDVHEHLTATQARLTTSIEEALSETFPDMQDPERRAALVANFNAICTDSMAQAMDGFHERYTEDVNRLFNSMESWDIAEVDEPTAELQKRFVHLWLQLIDEEIMKL